MCQVLSDGKGDCRSFKVPLPATDKPTAFTVLTTEDASRETKQNLRFPLQRAESPSDDQVLYSQKPGSTWLSLKKHPQSALKYKNLMCDSLCHGYKTKGSYKAVALTPHEGLFTYSIPQPSREHNFVFDRKKKKEETAQQWKRQREVYQMCLGKTFSTFWS